MCGWVTTGYKEGGKGGRGHTCVWVGDYGLQRRGERGEGMYMCVCG